MTDAGRTGMPACRDVDALLIALKELADREDDWPVEVLVRVATIGDELAPATREARGHLDGLGPAGTGGRWPDGCGCWAHRGRFR